MGALSADLADQFYDPETLQTIRLEIRVYPSR